MIYINILHTCYIEMYYIYFIDSLISLIFM